MANIKQAAVDYYKLGYMTTPLTADANGLPKRPFANGWQKKPRTQEALSSLPWGRAIGIGIVLGPVSSNLAVIDVDDVELSETLISLWEAAPKKTRLVRTIRKRLHIYVTEETPSASRAFPVRWRAKEIGIELKGQGTQVAAPPTPGYEVVSDSPPIGVPSIGLAWASLAMKLGVEMLTTKRGGAALDRGGADVLSGGRSTLQNKGAAYPRPWQEQVTPGNRNKAAYIEAHKLREAGIPIAQAVEIMRSHVERHYSPGEMGWHEVERTIESAYRKGVATMTKIATYDDLPLFRRR